MSELHPQDYTTTHTAHTDTTDYAGLPNYQFEYAAPQTDHTFSHDIPKLITTIIVYPKLCLQY